MDRSHRVDISGLLAGSRQIMAIDDEVPMEPFEGIDFRSRSKSSWNSAKPMACWPSRAASMRGRTVQCDACLEDVDLRVHVEVDERLDPSHGRDVDPFGESNVLTGERLDVADLAQQSLVSALPMGLRCSEECRGLCAVCGANRNTDECSCEGRE